MGLVLCAAVALTELRPAHAAPQQTSGPALFQEAKTLRSHGRFELACQRFAESQRAEPSIGALLNIADCDERAGKLVAAYDSCVAARELATTKADSERASFADSRAKELDARIPRLHLELHEPGVRGLRVTFNGTVVPEKDLRAPIRIDPGPHRIQVTAPGRSPTTVERSISPAERHVYVSLPRLSPLPNTEEGDRADAPAPAETSSDARIGVTTTAIGGALVVGGMITGMIAMSRWNEFLESCPDKKCPNESARDRSASDHSAATTYATASTVLFAGGLVLVAVGAYFTFFRNTGSAVLTPSVGPREASVNLGVRF